MPMHNTRSQYFRHLYANTFQIAISNNDIQIAYGIQTGEATNATDIEMEEQVSIATTHATIKLLTVMLSMLISDFEETIGQTIPLDESKIENLRLHIESLKSARQQTAP
jgi:hypothetical protein